MTTNRVKLTDRQLSEMTPWAIAEHYGIGYSGDMNPVEHGGFFYSLSDWESYGYASCVEFWEDPETHALVVQLGTIHKPDNDEQMDSAFLCSGISESEVYEELRANPSCQIECVKAYCGMEPDGTAYPSLKTFNLDNWQKEWRIWRSVRGWIEDLAR